MRKLLIASALTIAVIGTIYSCSNGPYDAHPDVDYGSGLNPYSDDSAGAKVYLGSMKGVMNNKSVVFSPAFLYDDENGMKQLVARIKDDTIYRRTLRITFNPYAGPREYNVTADTVNPVVFYTMVDTSRLDLAGRKVFKIFEANTGKGLGYSVVNVQGEEGGHLRGYFFGTLYLLDKDGKELEKVVFDYSDFYFEKVAYPVPNNLQDYVKY